MEISEFRKRMRDYVEGDQAWLEDEEWWTQVTDLSLLVLAERARVKRERAQDNPVYRKWKRKRDIEMHRFSFEGSTTQLALHLTSAHNVPEDIIFENSGGLTQGDWTALDILHREAHRKS